MPDAIQAITLFSGDLAVTRAFYRVLLDGADPIFEDDVSCVFRVGPTMVNLLDVTAAPELIDPAPVAAPGVRAVYTLGVADVDAEAARLTAAGQTLLNGPIDRPWGLRTVSLADPSGHVWELAAPL